MASGERRWWPSLVKDWGSEEGAWFAGHVAKQLAVENVEDQTQQFAALAQAAPLCFDCQAFLAKLAVYEGKEIHVRTPDSDWGFGLDGSVRRAARG